MEKPHKTIRKKNPKFRPAVADLHAITSHNLLDIFDINFTKYMQGLSYETIKIHYNQPTAKLFVIKNTNYCFNIIKDSYKPLLKNCLKQFEADEDYDKCIECRNLIDTL